MICEVELAREETYSKFNKKIIKFILSCYVIYLLLLPVGKHSTLILVSIITLNFLVSIDSITPSSLRAVTTNVKEREISFFLGTYVGCPIVLPWNYVL